MPQTLLDILLQRYPQAKRTTFRRMLQDRRIELNGQPARSLKQPIADSDRVVVHDARPAPQDPPPQQGASIPELDIVFEDDDVLVANKPAGLLTSTVPGERRPTLLAQVRDHVAAQPTKSLVGLIHRLDRDAAGLLVFSKNNAAYQSLKEQLQKRTMKRVYLAVVDGAPKPPTGRIKSRLVELTNGRVRSTRTEDAGELAITEYETLATARDRSLLRVTLQTGRKHQIRVHLSERGYPIVGDNVYNPKRASGLMLCAAELAFRHPRTGNEVTFKAPPPAQFARLFPQTKID